MARRVLRWMAAGLIVATVWVSTAYLWDMDRAYDRVRRTGTVIPSPYGDIEYTDGGSGPAVLVIHGSGGGYDQGELIAQAVLGEQFHWISPSRFGYLRSGLQGELTLLRSPQDTEEAQTCFQQALAVTRQQQAKWLELQAAIALSRLWLRIGKKQQARELLAPLYDSFTEGFEYADLKEAKALLDTLE